MAERGGGALLGAAWDLGATIGLYYALRAFGVPERVALLAATIVAGSRLVWVAVRHRRVTWFAALMMTVFGLGLLLTFVVGDVRFLLLTDSVMAAGVGVVFLLSARGRPLTLSAAQTSRPWAAAALDDMFDTRPDLRRRFVVSAVVWGAGLVVESVVRIPFVYVLDVDTMVLVSSLMLWGTIAALAVWSLYYTRETWLPGETGGDVAAMSSDPVPGHH